MNIFYLDANPKKAAQYMCDKHIGKMTVESAQILSTAHRVLDGELTREKSKSNRMVNRWILPDERDDLLYKATHINHPCSIWAREYSSNYDWLYNHFLALAEEFEFRYNKPHLTYVKLEKALSHRPKNIKIGEKTDPPLAMKAYPNLMKPDQPVQSYRNFYIVDKVKFAKWEKGRGEPWWWPHKNFNRIEAKIAIIVKSIAIDIKAVPNWIQGMVGNEFNEIRIVNDVNLRIRSEVFDKIEIT